MAKNNKRRLYVLGKNIVQVEGEEIIKTFSLNNEAMEREIEHVIAEGIERPNQIFQIAVERVTGETFGDIRRKFIISGKEYSIYDQDMYKLYEAFILNNEIIKRKFNIKIQMKKEHNQYLQKEREIKAYIKEDKYNAIRYIKNHRPDLTKRF